MNDKEIQVIDFAYLRMCAEHDYIYETGEAKLLLNYITNLQQENARLKDKIEKAIEKIKNIDKFEERLNDDTRIYMIQDADVDEIERILKEN